MFLVRSAFWLAIAFVLIAPGYAEKDGVAGDYGTDALAQGGRFIVGQFLQTDCQTLQCAGTEAALHVLTGNETPSLGATMQAKPNLLVPLPRPRPDRMG